ncbi:MAG TPA: prephenate dehydrogenase/arogenate dehydrogenase family protein [Chthonomonadales bacterium]|nr:prephenate dehydrogenase/arogenate dehydrogenase family protein [Chthonomonadales bacterium]
MASPPSQQERPQAPSPFRRIAVIGLGLIGGSIGLAARAASTAKEIAGFDKSPDTVQGALALGAIDVPASTLKEAVTGADLIILAAPLQTVPALLEEVAAHSMARALVTDVGSVKQQIVQVGHKHFGNRFVGGHPMAGSEQNGLVSASAELFAGAPWAIVRSDPFSLAADRPCRRIAEFVSALGARPEPITCETHDRAVAVCSHLPHIISFAFARMVPHLSFAEDVLRLAGPSFRDFMRVSRSSPDLWSRIFADNRLMVSEACDSFLASLKLIAGSIESADPDDIRASLVVESDIAGVDDKRA